VTSQGAGLGLAIVVEIMKMHGGSVKVDDGPSGGAMFTLSFSLENQEMSEAGGFRRAPHAKHSLSSRNTALSGQRFR
jgi:hypothetical protein